VALCGARTPQQAIENARAGTVVLGAEDLRHIDAAADRHLGALMG
jgi:methylglyoxal reductase